MCSKVNESALSKKYLPGASSIFLDLLRLSCALVVFFTHSRAIWFPEKKADDFIPSHLSHGAVIIFFVLSGYVIAYTTSIQQRSGREYLTARLARLYSILLPSLVITVACAISAAYLNPEIYALYNRGNSIARYGMTLMCSNELWFLSAAPLINGPVWSLGYEFWFYALFGAVTYRRKGWQGWVLPSTLCLVVGPKILLMMLIWWMGWAAYYFSRPAISKVVSWTVTFALLSLGVGLMFMAPSIPQPVNTPPWFWAGQFVSDWMVGFFVAIAVWIIPVSSSQDSASERFTAIRAVANMTFPIYVLHFPLLVLARCLVPGEWPRELQWLTGGSSALLVTTGLGFAFEAKKEWWKRVFRGLITAVCNFFPWLRRGEIL